MSKAPFIVIISHLYYNMIQHVCEVISGYIVVSAQNCPKATLNYHCNANEKTVVRTWMWGLIALHLAVLESLKKRQQKMIKSCSKLIGKVIFLKLCQHSYRKNNITNELMSQSRGANGRIDQC